MPSTSVSTGHTAAVSTSRLVFTFPLEVNLSDKPAFEQNLDNLPLLGKWALYADKDKDVVKVGIQQDHCPPGSIGEKMKITLILRWTSTGDRTGAIAQNFYGGDLLCPDGRWSTLSVRVSPAEFKRAVKLSGGVFNLSTHTSYSLEVSFEGLPPPVGAASSATLSVARRVAGSFRFSFPRFR